MKHTIDVRTDHFQLLFGDRDLAPNVDTTRLWASDGPVATLLSSPEIVGVGTIRFGGLTHVAVEVTEDLSAPTDRDWTILGTFTLSVPSGALVFWGPESPRPTEGPKVILPAPGTYQGILLAQGIDQVKDEMAPDGPDIYRLVLRRKEVR